MRFIGRGKFLYETRVLDNSYLQFKFQLPTFDSTQITAGGPKVPIEGFVPLDAPSGKKYMCTLREYFNIFNCDFSFNFLALVLSEILGGPKFTLGGPTPPRCPLAEKFFYPKRVLHNI